MKSKKRYRKKSKPQKTQNLSNTSIFVIFLGSLFLTMGFVIGDLHITNNIVITKTVNFLIGFTLQSFTIAFFVKSKLLNTPR